MAVFHPDLTTANSAGVTGTTSVAAADGTKIITSAGNIVTNGVGIAYTLLTSAPSSADQFAQGVFATNTGNTGLVLAAVDEGAGLVTCYFARHTGSKVGFYKVGSDGVSVALPSNVSGSTTDVSHTRVIGQTMRSWRSGSTLTVAINGAVLRTITDSTLARAGTVGWRMGAATGTGMTNIYAGTLAEMAGVPDGSAAASSPPTVPTNLAVNVPSSGTAVANWAPVVGAVSYTVEIGLVTGETPAIATGITGTTTSATLSPGNYRARVKAANAAGTSAFSDYYPFTVAGTIVQTYRVPRLDLNGRLPAEHMPSDYGDKVDVQSMADALAAQAALVPASWSDYLRQSDCSTIPATLTDSSALTLAAGIIYAARAQSLSDKTFTKVRIGVTAVGTAITNLRVGVWDLAGSLLAQSTAVSLSATGVIEADLTASLALNKGAEVYIGIGGNAFTGTYSVIRRVTGSTTALNFVYPRTWTVTAAVPASGTLPALTGTTRLSSIPWLELA